MKKQFKLNGLGCADCASKMERGIAKLSGVNKVSINFITTKLTIEADDAAMSEVLEQAAKIVDKIEPGVTMTRA